MVVAQLETSLTMAGEQVRVLVDAGSAQGVQVGNVFTVIRQADPILSDVGVDPERQPGPEPPGGGGGALHGVDVREAVTTCLLLRSYREVVVGDRVELRAGAPKLPASLGKSAIGGCPARDPRLTGGVGRLCLAAASGRSPHFYIGGPGLAGAGPRWTPDLFPAPNETRLLALWAVPGIGSIGLGGVRAVGRRAVGGPAGHPDPGLGGRPSGERPRPGAESVPRGRSGRWPTRCASGPSAGAWRCSTRRPGLPRAPRRGARRAARCCSCGGPPADRGGGSRWWARGTRSRATSTGPGVRRGGWPAPEPASCPGPPWAWTAPATSERWTWAARPGRSSARRWTRWTPRRRASCR
jgi:hypothetical protein